MRKKVFCLLVLVLVSRLLRAQVDIQVTSKDTTNNWLYVAELFGDQQFFVDSFAFSPNGVAAINSDSIWEQGMYLFSDKTGQYAEVLLTDDQAFKLKLDLLQFEGSVENELFRGYVDSIAVFTRVINDKSAFVDIADEEERAELNLELRSIKKAAQVFQLSFLNQYQDYFFSNLLRAGIPVGLPDSILSEQDEELRIQKIYNFKLLHFFDHMNFNDERLLRTPIYHTQLTTYFEEVVWPLPDSLFSAAFALTQRMQRKKGFSRYLSSYLLNFDQYTSHLSADLLIVALYDEYMKREQLNWLPKAQLQGLTNRIERLRPLLVGKVGPDLELVTIGGEAQQLHAYMGRRVVLFFWSVDCDHCLEVMPMVQEAYAKAKNNSWEFVAIYTGQDVKEWQRICKEKGYDWPSLYDPKATGLLFEKYNVYMTPSFFLLDDEFRILLKNFSAEQLSPIIDVFDEQ